MFVLGIDSCVVGSNERSVNVEGIMSTPSGLGNRVDKNKGKYKAIEINKVYKGTSVEPQRNSGNELF